MTTSDCIIKIQHHGPPSAIRCKCIFVRTSSYNAEELLAQSGENNRGQATFPSTVEVEPFRAAETGVDACPAFLPRHGAEPGLETRLAESCVSAWNQCSLTDFCPRVKRFWVRDDFAGIFECGQSPPYQFIHAELFRAPNFHDAVYRRAYGDLAYATRNIVSRHGLKEHRGHAHHVAVGGNVGDALDELEELSRTDD